MSDIHHIPISLSPTACRIILQIEHEQEHGCKPGGVLERLDAIEKKLEALHQLGEKIMAAIDVANQALSDINDATNSIATISQNISTEVDQLIASQPVGSTITQDFLDRLQATSNANKALVPVLQGIAAKGAVNPVPVPVPPAA